LIQMEVKLKAVFYIKHLKICYWLELELKHIMNIK
jgi:hypothetical protein